MALELVAVILGVAFVTNPRNKRGWCMVRGRGCSMRGCWVGSNRLGWLCIVGPDLIPHGVGRWPSGRGRIGLWGWITVGPVGWGWWRGSVCWGILGWRGVGKLTSRVRSVHLRALWGTLGTSQCRLPPRQFHPLIFQLLPALLQFSFPSSELTLCPQLRINSGLLFFDLTPLPQQPFMLLPVRLKCRAGCSRKRLPVSGVIGVSRKVLLASGVLPCATLGIVIDEIHFSSGRPCLFPTWGKRGRLCSGMCGLGALRCRSKRGWPWWNYRLSRWLPLGEAAVVTSA